MNSNQTDPDAGSTPIPNPVPIEPTAGEQPSPVIPEAEVAPAEPVDANKDQIRINGKRVGAYRKPRSKGPGARPITMEEAGALDKSAMMPIQRPDKLVLRAVKKLGLSDKTWDMAKLMAAQELGRYASMKITANVLLVRSFTSLEQVERAMAIGVEIAEGTDNKYTNEERLTAVNMVANCAKAFKDLSGQIVTLAEKGAEKIDTSAPKNLPPGNNFQFNFGGNPPATVAVEAPASSGQTEPTGVIEG